MRDIPAFTTQYGVASLTLREIPYKQEAYIRFQFSVQADALLQECIGFCRACGAERIYATGDEYLAQFPLHTEIWNMQAAVESMPRSEACLFPLQRQTLPQWLSAYNERMQSVPNAATMTNADGEKLLEEGSGYFVHKDGALIGIGKAAGGRIEAVASLVPGAGRDVVVSLCGALSKPMAQVEVASENRRAVRLYEKLGFVKTQVISRWYRVFPDENIVM